MNFKEEINKKFKEQRINQLPGDQQKSRKIQALDNTMADIVARRNRFIFYCPDIAVVNPLAKLVYETALKVKNAGHQVVMLHEMSGFRAKWLYESKGYEEYAELDVEYIIKKVQGKKSKKTDNSYSFKISDTLIVTDAYQDMLENMMSEDSLKLVQKVVLVTGYMGLSSLKPGMDYTRMNVDSLIFFDENVKSDYDSLFSMKGYLLFDYPVSVGFDRSLNVPTEVVPVIALTSVGNNEKAQQLINIFYNKYPHLSMFTFKIAARETLDVFIDNIRTSAAFVMLDKNIVTMQLTREVIGMGTPIILPRRREYIESSPISDFVVDDDVFVMADQIAAFCTYWLGTSTVKIKQDTLDVYDRLELADKTQDSFGENVAAVFAELHSNRLRTFGDMVKFAKDNNV